MPNADLDKSIAVGMKNFLAIVGGVLGIVVAVSAIIIAIFVRRDTRLDKQAREYIDSALPKIVTTWDRQALIDRATPELTSVLNSGNGAERLFPTWRRLGALKHLEKPAGDVRLLNLRNTGLTTVGRYRIRAEFEKANAMIGLELRRSNETWLINGFHVQSINSDVFVPPDT